MIVGYEVEWAAAAVSNAKNQLRNPDGFTVCIRTENQNQASFSPFGPHEISVLIELTLGHLRYHLTDVPPQPNSPPDYVFRTDQLPKEATLNQKLA